jgi:hypothetical protein
MNTGAGLPATAPSACGGPGALDDDHKAVVLLEHGLGDLKQLVGAARGAHGLHHRGEAGVLGIAGRDEMRADIRAAFKRLAAALVALATAAEITARTAGAAFKPAAAAIRTIAHGRLALTGGSARGLSLPRTTGADRLAEGTTVPRRGTVAAAVITARRTVAAVEIAFAAAAGGYRLHLGPLGAEVKGLQLTEVDFVQPLVVGFVGRLGVVHERAENGRGYPVGSG